jgi:hypothetical protein
MNQLHSSDSQATATARERKIVSSRSSKRSQEKDQEKSKTAGHATLIPHSFHLLRMYCHTAACSSSLRTLTP